MARMLTTSEVAALTDPATSRYTVEREIGRGNLDAEKIGGRWLIGPDDAAQWAKGYQPFREQRERHHA